MNFILANLPALIAAGKSIFDLVNSIRTAAQQSGEWTTEHESQFQALLVASATAPEWQPDALPGVVIPPSAVPPA